MPSFFIQPGQRLVVVELGASLSPANGDPVISASFAAGYQGTPGASFLCNGNCLLPGNVTDYVAWDNVNEPSFASMTPAPVSGVSSIDTAVVRVASASVAPSFVASDWAVTVPSY